VKFVDHLNLNFLKLSVGVATFLVGAFSVAFIFNPDHFPIPQVSQVAVVQSQAEEFDFRQLVQACGSLGGVRSSFSAFELSDGAKLHTTLLYGFKSRAAALRRFRIEISGASKVIDRSPQRDYFFSGNAFGRS
jgi:hypothetical protein